MCAGDGVEVLDRPAHGITVPEVFRAFTGDDQGAARVLAERVLAGRPQRARAAPVRRRPTGTGRAVPTYGAGYRPVGDVIATTTAR